MYHIVFVTSDTQHSVTAIHQTSQIVHRGRGPGHGQDRLVNTSWPHEGQGHTSGDGGRGGARDNAGGEIEIEIEIEKGLFTEHNIHALQKARERCRGVYPIWLIF